MTMPYGADGAFTNPSPYAGPSSPGGILTTLGDLLYENATPTPTRLPGNITAVKQFLTQTGTGVISAAPVWAAIASADLPGATTSLQGAVILDGTAANIKPVAGGTAATAGPVGKAADSGHIHTQQVWTAPDHGLLAWNMDWASAASPRAATGAGILQVIAFKLLVQISVTNIVMYVATAGGTLTSGQCFASLFGVAGSAVIGTTADQATAWQSTGLKTMALASGPFNVGPGICYVGWWYNGTTSPSFSGGDNATAKINVGLAGSSSRFGVANTGLTTTPPGTLGTISASTASAWYCALS